MKRLSLFALCLSFVSLAGCPTRTGPDVSWRRFVEATRKGDADAAWSLLSKATQEQVTQDARAVAKAEGREPPKDGRALLLSRRSSLVREPKIIEAVFDGEDAATVQVVDEAGDRSSVRAVREEGRWRFDLRQELGAGR